jgi:hypothetical protein
MGDFRMEEEGVEAADLVRHRRDRCVGARRSDGETRRRGLHEVAVAGPDAQLRADRRQHRRAGIDGDRRETELAMRRRRDLPAEHVGHQLHAVADAEHGDVRREYGGVAPRSRRFGDAARPARQHDADRIPRADLRQRRVEGKDFGVHREFAQPARNQLRELRTEIEDDDGLVSHRGFGNLEIWEFGNLEMHKSPHFQISKFPNFQII